MYSFLSLIADTADINPQTGIAGIATVLGIAIAAIAGVFFSIKKKKK